MLSDDKPRRVVPRWRPSWLTATTPEAKSGSPGVKADFSLELKQAAAELAAKPIVPVASEAMFVGLASGDTAIAQAAARLIAASGIPDGSVLRSEALRVLSGARGQPLTDPRTVIKHGRQLLRIDYRNPVLLTDIALALTSLGHEGAAERYIKAALALAPNSRFVLRSASRFFLHTGDDQRAHDILKAAPRVKADPWLQASEIAVATVRGRPSMLKKSTLRDLIDATTIDLQRTELASAVATVELLSGETKRAKKLFQKSIEHPNDNSLAQAEWAAQRLKLVVDEQALSTPLSFEAKSNFAFRQLNLDEAISQAVLWSQDEPFASRPHDFLAFLYCLSERFTEAECAALRAEELEDRDVIAHQLNVVFARIQQRQLDGIAEELNRLASHGDARNHVPHLLANMGAYFYEQGDFLSGRDAYRKAIGAARARSDRRLEALGYAYFARAAIRNGDEIAALLVKEATAVVERVADPGAIVIMRNIVEAPDRLKLDRAATTIVKKRTWSWDPSTNTLRPSS
jgi:tetratricopeptide (TPR) repeat protein